MDSTTPYREISEVEATDAGLPEQPDTTYRKENGETFAYNAGTRCFWKLGRSNFGADDGGHERRATPIGRAIAAAQATLADALALEGGEVLCAVMLVHAQGVKPDAGVDAVAHDTDGPQDPDDLLAFAITAVGQLAERYGLPFAVLEGGPGIGAQG